MRGASFNQPVRATAVLSAFHLGRFEDASDYMEEFVTYPADNFFWSAPAFILLFHAAVAFSEWIEAKGKSVGAIDRNWLSTRLFEYLKHVKKVIASTPFGTATRSACEILFLIANKKSGVALKKWNKFAASHHCLHPFVCSTEPPCPMTMPYTNSRLTVLRNHRA